MWEWGEDEGGGGGEKEEEEEEEGTMGSSRRRHDGFKRCDEALHCPDILWSHAPHEAGDRDAAPWRASGVFLWVGGGRVRGVIRHGGPAPGDREPKRQHETGDTRWLSDDGTRRTGPPLGPFLDPFLTSFHPTQSIHPTHPPHPNLFLDPWLDTVRFSTALDP